MMLLSRMQNWLARRFKPGFEWNCAICGAPTERVPHVIGLDGNLVSLCPACHDAHLRARAAASPTYFNCTCAYCGAPTAQKPYSDEYGDWPPCCARFSCLERWEPRRRAP